MQQSESVEQLLPVVVQQLPPELHIWVEEQLPQLPVPQVFGPQVLPEQLGVQPPLLDPLPLLEPVPLLEPDPLLDPVPLLDPDPLLEPVPLLDPAPLLELDPLLDPELLLEPPSAQSHVE